MAKGGLLQVLAPVLGIGAALAAPELLPALGIGEAAAGGAATAAGLSDVVPAGLLDAAGGVIPGEIGAGTAAELGATALAPEALAGIGDVTGLLTSAAGAIPGVAGQAATDLGTTQASLLGADTAAAPGAAATPGLATTPVAGPINTGTMAATSAAPGLATGPLPAGFTPGIAPDLTVAGLPGPAAGQTVNMFATETADAGGAGIGTTGSIPSDTSFLIPGTDTPLDASGFAVDIGGGGAGGGDIGTAAGKIGDWAASHPGALLTAGLAGTQLLQGQPTYPAAASLQGIAGPLGTQGQGLVSAGGAGLQRQAATTAGETAALTAPLTTGILPPGLEQGVDQAANAQKAQVRSTYASLGLTGSTMEADKLAQVDANTASQKAGIAEGLLPAAAQFSAQTSNTLGALTQTGANLSGLSVDAYNNLVRTQMQTDQNYQAALYKFAAALAGGGYQPPVANA